MFQFRAFPAYTYLIQCTLTRYCRAGFPHSDISGSMRMCHSPKLFAACRVLHRLLMPRHSPCALISLTISLVLKELCSSQKNLYRSKNCSCYPIFHNIFSSITAGTLCCLASSSSPLFSFQGAASGQRPDQNAQNTLSVLIHSLVEISGIEPLTSCVQSRRSPI